MIRLLEAIVVVGAAVEAAAQAVMGQPATAAFLILVAVAVGMEFESRPRRLP